ncbi:hypothetical protein E8E14_014072 [Neopestalotiopsis sp. 37M]|nr:hypothetical protein E8E14_014072 [Neopestalotiopsis sp. 37M]
MAPQIASDDASEVQTLQAVTAEKTSALAPPLETRAIEREATPQDTLVDFDGEDDLTNPKNWSRGRKWALVLIVSTLDFAVNLGVIICAPVAPQVLAEFHEEGTSYLTLIITIWEMGEILGPLIVAPLSELYGRFYIYHAGTILFIVFSAACALSTNIHMLVAFRFLNGMAVVSTALNPSTVGDLFPVEQRGNAMAIAGLAPMLGPVVGIGCVVGVFLCSATLDIWVRRQSKSGQTQPEQRLPPLIFGGLILPIALFFYGWTTEFHVHYMAPIMATGMIGVGLVSTTIPVRSYLVDAFGLYSASAIAGSAAFRNFCGTVIPLSGPPLYRRLGLGWGNSVLGFIALAIIPVPLLLMKFGQRLRMRDRQEFV